MNKSQLKPLGRKNYGHIPHLEGSRMGPGDHKCSDGQTRIATVQARDKHDEIFLQEKLDGSNVGVARIDDQLYPIGRSGYPAISSSFIMHKYFHNWVFSNVDRFMSVLQNGERLVGEWLCQAHGTRYTLSHEPFVVFDLMIEDRRLPYDQFMSRLKGLFVIPKLLHRGGSINIENGMSLLGPHGFHGAIDLAEGLVWRIERDNPTGEKGKTKRVVDFLVKYVRPDKVDGIYLPEQSGNDPIWNWNL